MNIIACIVLIFCGLVLMLSQGVGPFAKDPWEKYYFSFRQLSPFKRYSLIIPASILALLSSLVLIGLIQ